MSGHLAACAALAFALAGCDATIGDLLEPGPGPGEGVPTAPDAATPAPPGDPDASTPPAPPPDAEVPVVSPEERCVELYGTVPDFELCSTTPDTCDFLAATRDLSCGTHCAARGGACVGAVDQKVGSCTNLESNPTADCDTTGKTDLRCTCTLPPPG
jgi:hypothetical protein